MINMTDRIAKPVVKNKFWVVEDQGHRVATIQAVEDGGFVYVHDEQRERFNSIKLLSKQYNIVFDKTAKTSKTQPAGNNVYGYPTQAKPYNELYDVSRKLPVYTKTTKSKSYFCAGYYIVQFDSHWAKAYCPKLITLNRYPFRGPFATQEQMLQELRKQNGQ
jgi:hypothetical protein